MDWKTFLANLVKSLAWPATVLICVWVLNEPIQKLIPQTSKVEVGQFTAEFSRDLEIVEKLSPHANTHSVAEVLNGPAMRALQSFASENPRTAIIEGWDFLIENAHSALTSAGASVNRNSETPYRDTENALEQYQLLGPAALKTFNELRNLRNTTKYAPSDQLFSEQAVEYLQLCAIIIVELNSR